VMMYKNTQKGGGAQITTLADQSVLTAAGSGMGGRVGLHVSTVLVGGTLRTCLHFSELMALFVFELRHFHVATHPCRCTTVCHAWYTVVVEPCKYC
jgi:hypothetical protein